MHDYHQQLKNSKEFKKIKSEIQEIVQNKICETLFDEEYCEIQSKDWSNNICCNVVKELMELNMNFKYIVSSMIVSADVNKLDMRAICFWNNQTDGFITVKWQSDQMKCLVNVYGCKL